MKYSEVSGHLQRALGDVEILKVFLEDAKKELVHPYRLHYMKKVIVKGNEITSKLQEMMQQPWEDD